MFWRIACAGGLSVLEGSVCWEQNVLKESGFWMVRAFWRFACSEGLRGLEDRLFSRIVCSGGLHGLEE